MAEDAETVPITMRLRRDLAKRIEKLQKKRHWRNRTVALETLLYRAVTEEEAKDVVESEK